MAGQVVELRRAEAWMRELFGSRLQAAIDAGLKRGAEAAVQVLRAATDAAPPASLRGVRGAVASGAYRAGWFARPTKFGVEVGNAVPYAAFVEYGRPVGGRMPPVMSISAWGQRRLGWSPTEAKRRGFAVAKAIQKRGLAPRYVLANATPEIQRAVERALGEAVAAELGK